MDLLGARTSGPYFRVAAFLEARLGGSGASGSKWEVCHIVFSEDSLSPLKDVASVLDPFEYPPFGIAARMHFH